MLLLLLIYKKKKEKVFSFLSKDEVEKLKQEEEKKIATFHRDKKAGLIESPNDIMDEYDNDEDGSIEVDSKTKTSCFSGDIRTEDQDLESEDSR